MKFSEELIHQLIEFYTEWFSVCPEITSTYRTIALSHEIHIQVKLVHSVQQKSSGRNILSPKAVVTYGVIGVQLAT
jgi:hypothetical protein